jgi:hypothetical protein
MSHVRQATNHRGDIDSVRILARGVSKSLGRGGRSKLNTHRRNQIGVGLSVPGSQKLTQQVIIKSRIVPVKPVKGAIAIQKHIAYLTRDAVGIDGGDGVVFNSDELLDKQMMSEFVDRGLSGGNHLWHGAVGHEEGH